MEFFPIETKKAESPLSRQPGCPPIFIWTRGFPSLSHGRFGFINQIRSKTAPDITSQDCRQNRLEV